MQSTATENEAIFEHEVARTAHELFDNMATTSADVFRPGILSCTLFLNDANQHLLLWLASSGFCPMNFRKFHRPLAKRDEFGTCWRLV